MDRKIKGKSGSRGDRGRGKMPAASELSSPGEKLSPASSKIVLAFHEVIEAMRSGGPAATPITAHTYKAEFTCPVYGPEDVLRARHLLGMSQVLFARFLGVAPNTVRSWEQGTRPPSPIARRFMGEIEGDPEYWRGLIARSLVNGASTRPERL